MSLLNRCFSELIQFLEIKISGLLVLEFCVLLSGSPAFSRTQLAFPPEKNNVLTLPQKFEYSLRDSYKLLLGHRIIDTSLLSFGILKENSDLQIVLTWPSQIFEKAHLRILNPTGVAVWSDEADASQSSKTLSSATGLLQQLSGLSFFRFCVGYHEQTTGIEICSPELVLKGSGQLLRAESRQARRTPLITINGRRVTPHGIVFWNDAKESLSFRAIALSGAEFRLDTRRIFLDFLDAVQVDEENFLLTVKGPPPLAPTVYKPLEDGTWSIALKKERPRFYVAGEGKVPLRQEFVVQFPLPTEKHRLHIAPESPKRTYAPSVEIRGHLGELGDLQSQEGSETAVAGRNFSWFLKNIPQGQEKQVYLQIRDEDRTYTAAHMISRQDSSRLELMLGLNSDDTRL